MKDYRMIKNRESLGRSSRNVFGCYVRVYFDLQSIEYSKMYFFYMELSIVNILVRLIEFCWQQLLISFLIFYDLIKQYFGKTYVISG